MTNKEIQKKLISLGFPVGKAGADGIMGRDTQAALRRYQQTHKLPITGLADTLTLNLLFGKSQPSASVPMPPWLDLANQKKGLHESRDNGILRTFLKLGKGTIGDPAKIAWCGDFVETCIAVSLPNETVLANPYAAINWLKFGVETQARVGAVLVFHRGDPKSWQGHVGFYVGEDATHYHVLGGNQSNAVTISRIAKGRLRPGGIRWPATYPANTNARVTTAGDLKVTTNEE
jgi:uncharacterized protein (TIGR02594 family)